MESLVDKFVDFAKSLPGFGLVFLLTTLGYMFLKGDYAKPSPEETLVTAFLCWLLYHAASYLLDKCYDKAYAPESNLGWLWKSDDLRAARNKAAQALFGPIDSKVIDYTSAKTRRHIGDRPLKSLYSLCTTIAKPTDAWRRKIEPKIEISKAARTVFAFVFVAALIAMIPPLRDWAYVAPYIERLGVFSNGYVLFAIALVALMTYIYLRILHNVELYDHIAKEVKHLPTGDDFALVIFEVTILKKSPPNQPLQQTGPAS